jgi:hypothetical protein
MAYIHSSCLDEYIRFYPDRFCRVCQAPFVFRSPRDTSAMASLYFFFQTFLLASDLPFGIKVVVFLASTLFFRNVILPSSVSWSAITILCIVNLLTMPILSMMYLAGLVILTIGYLIPAEYVLCMAMITLVSGYIFLIAFVAASNFNSFTNALLLGTVFILWNTGMRAFDKLRV